MKGTPSGLTIGVSALREYTRSAFEHGIAHLLSTTLPSSWDQRGCGWQEHWEEQKSAGFYASCDGILLLSALPQETSIDTAVAGSVLQRAYNHHLCPFLDNAVAVDLDKQQARRRCRGTTMKLAKFVQASAAVPAALRRDDLFIPLKKTLVDVGHQAAGSWSATVGTDTPRLSATCEGLLALAAIHDQETVAALLSGQQYLLGLLHSDIDIEWRIVIISTLLDIASQLQENPPSELGEIARQTLPAIDSLEQELVVEFFPTVKGDSDYYHFNVKLLGARALISLYRLGMLNSDFLRFAIPVIDHTARNILLNGRYRAASPTAQPRFWEYYQAMRLLSDFNQLDVPESQEISLMWVSPKHFEPKNFDVDDGLIVVLMPLSTDWSNDVFAALKKVKKVKNSTYRYWRSDQRFQDDKIMQSIWEEINKARFIIADCTGKNPNVFYELGIAHTLGKSVFICAQNREDIPFDLAAIRSYEYGSPRPGQLRALQTALTKFINDLQ
jgi:hypothetical protein